MTSHLDENPADPVLIVVPILLSWTVSYFTEEQNRIIIALPGFNHLVGYLV